MKKNGFTLIELMMVIVIIGILTAMSMPRFQIAADKAKAAEAPLILTTMASAEESFRIINGEYLSLSHSETMSPAEIANWEKLGLKIPEITFFLYTVTSPAGEPAADDTKPTFIAQATLIRNLSRVKEDSFIQLNQDGVKSVSAIGKKLTENDFKLLIPSFFD